jgi:hypothetical protein
MNYGQKYTGHLEIPGALILFGKNWFQLGIVVMVRMWWSPVIMVMRMRKSEMRVIVRMMISMMIMLMGMTKISIV